jgi:hypothetical protein
MQQINHHLFSRIMRPGPGHDLTRNLCIENHYLDFYSQRRIELGLLVLLQPVQLFPPQMHGMVHILFPVQSAREEPMDVEEARILGVSNMG